MVPDVYIGRAFQLVRAGELADAIQAVDKPTLSSADARVPGLPDGLRAALDIAAI